ncbi:MAG: class I SAM-dependent methyltransferase [Alphaproteobacteria bacterium]|nr:class I SAM-dependent methyltransferase [Alphaproteobacteria bacterium]
MTTPSPAPSPVPSPVPSSGPEPTETTIDKAQQQALWTERSAGWEKWAERRADMAEKMNLPLLELARVGTGHRVLDLASGIGEPGFTAARLVGDAGHVTLTDLTPAMLDGAKRRAEQRGLTNVDFQVADAESLPFPDNHFDRVTCRFGLMFVPDKLKALREALRVLKPGGRIGYMVWGPLEDNTLFRISRQVAEAVFDPEMMAFMRVPFSMSAPGSLESLFAEAGFAEIEERPFEGRPKAPLDEPFYRTQLDMSFGVHYSDADQATKDRIEALVVDSLQPHRESDGYRLQVHSRYATGVKPD